MLNNSYQNPTWERYIHEYNCLKDMVTTCSPKFTFRQNCVLTLIGPFRPTSTQACAAY